MIPPPSKGPVVFQKENPGRRERDGRMLSIAICEDETAAAETLEKCIQAYCDANGIPFRVNAYANPILFLTDYKANYENESVAGPDQPDGLPAGACHPGQPGGHGL